MSHLNSFWKDCGNVSGVSFFVCFFPSYFLSSKTTSVLWKGACVSGGNPPHLDPRTHTHTHTTIHTIQQAPSTCSKNKWKKMLEQWDQVHSALRQEQTVRQTWRVSEVEHLFCPSARLQVHSSTSQPVCFLRGIRPPVNKTHSLSCCKTTSGTQLSLWLGGWLQLKHETNRATALEM